MFVTKPAVIFCLVFLLALMVTSSEARRHRKRNGKPGALIQRRRSRYQSLGKVFTRKQLANTFSQGCGMLIKMRCNLIVHRCHTGVLSKRSIDDQENTKRTTNRRQRRRRATRRRRKGKKVIRQVKISCPLCRHMCWY